MVKFYTIIILIIIPLITKSQCVIYQEGFDGGHAWTFGVTTGFVPPCSGAVDHEWAVGSAEGGRPVGSCGGAGGSNSLHVTCASATACPFGFTGAVYNSGGGTCPGDFGCDFFGVCNTTSDIRAQSANIDTRCRENLVLNFSYIELGSGTIDNAFVEYSIDGGGTWLMLGETTKSAVSGCGGGQHRWQLGTFPIPATAENITTLRIAFRWVNNNDATGTDPSFAVDNIEIVADPPVNVNDDNVTFTPDVTNAVPVQANDDYTGSYGACPIPFIPLTMSITSGPANGSAVINGNNIDYTPNPGYTGADAVTYQLCDNTLPVSCCNSATINLTGTPIVAPVELTNFKAKAKKEKVVLVWETVEEINFEKFIIEKSKNSINFEPIGEVSGTENSLAFQVYNFIDVNPLLGNNYYRLKVVDRDGSYSYTTVQHAYFDELGTQVIVIPNPAYKGTNEVLLVYASASKNEGTIKVFDIIGTPIYYQVIEMEEGINQIPLSVQDFPSGHYIVQIQNQNFGAVTRFVKSEN